jgi:hypothetical protein
MLKSIRAGLSRAAIIPFETAIGVLVIISGIAGLMKFGVVDPVAQLLPYWEFVAVNVMYLLAGVGIITGILVDLGDIEAFGLWFLSGAIIARFVLYGYYLGIDKNFIITGTFDFAFVVAAYTRLRHIKKRQVLIKLPEHNTGDLDGFV